MAIAENERFSKVGADSQGKDLSHSVRHLPSSWGTLYELTRQMAYKPMAIAENERFSFVVANSQGLELSSSGLLLSMVGADSQGKDVSPRGDILPGEWTILYELGRLSDDVYEHAVQEGWILPDTTQAAVMALAWEADAGTVKQEHKARQEREGWTTWATRSWHEL